MQQRFTSKFFIALTFTISSLCTELFAQEVNNDCFKIFTSGRLICGNATFGADNLNGYERNDFSSANNNNPGCLGIVPSTGVPEGQSAWYAFSVATAGTLTFIINPLGPDDFDFAVWGPFDTNSDLSNTCKNLGTPTRCSYAADVPPGANTGLSLTATDESEGGGGNGLVKYLDVLPGQLYIILVNNWDNNNQGFGFEWGGTAQLAVGAALFKFTQSCNVVSFSDDSGVCGDDYTLEYEWDFGDNSPVTSNNFVKNPVHRYATTGTFTVTLTITIVSDDANNGVESTATREVVISKVPPLVSIPNVNDTYCIGDPAVPLTGNPVGGVFYIKKNQTGTSTVATQFDPTALGVGTHEIIYQYKDPADLNCVGEAIRVVAVNDLPDAQITNLLPIYCQSVSTFTLTGSPTGGVFKIDGTVATELNPANLSIGDHIVAYTYTDAMTTCSKTTTQAVSIKALPLLTLGSLRESYCTSSAATTIQPTPVGGTLTVDGVSTNQFNPAALDIGDHTVIYNFTDVFGCSNTLTKQVRIDDTPFLILQNLNPNYCVDDAAFSLQATPTGGTFKINGNNATQFNPAALGVGLHTVVYNYADPNDASCANVISQEVRVYPLPMLIFKNVNNRYCVSENSTITPQAEATLANGTVQTIILTSAQFNPSVVGVGTQNLSYTFTDPNTGCDSNIQKTVIINALPILSFVNLETQYCQQAFATTLQANPSGGSFTINGQSATQLDPTDFQVGDRPTVTYTYTDANGCSNSVSQVVEITPADQFIPEILKDTLCPPEAPGFQLEALTMAAELDFINQGKQPEYFWTPDVGNGRFIYLKNEADAGIYEVVIRDAAGCPIGKKTFDIAIDCVPDLFIPTAFTPNGDNLNDVLTILGGDFTDLDFRIFNRWGEIIFATNDPQNAWNGKLGAKPAPAGVYIWKAIYRNILRPGEKLEKQGRFTLIR
jgi:gliding motility-associated-like protein